MPASSLDTLRDAALNVWVAWGAHTQRTVAPGGYRRPGPGAANRASRVFLKALCALPADTPGLAKALEQVTEHVRSDIPALSALYAHPRGPRCEAGALSLLLNANADKWYAPSGLGQLMQAMLARGASPHHGSGHAFPLLQAVRIGSPDAVEVLLAAGANPEGLMLDQADPSEHPLSLAFTLGHTACVKALLSGGADPARVFPKVLAFSSAKSDGYDWQDKKIAAWKECAEVLRAHQMGRRLDTALKAPENTDAEPAQQAPRHRM